MNIPQNLSLFLCACILLLYTRLWFQIFFIFTPIWGRFPFWLIFFRWVETTNQYIIHFFWSYISRRQKRLKLRSLVLFSYQCSNILGPLWDVGGYLICIPCYYRNLVVYMDVSKNRGTPKSSIINYPFGGVKKPYFWKHPYTIPFQVELFQFGYLNQEWLSCFTKFQVLALRGRSKLQQGLSGWHNREAFETGTLFGCCKWTKHQYNI